MARKAFFAAFVIDEEAYTPEPGPVDRHFVVADLAQSSFGEQSGVSNFIVWVSAEHMIADHRQRSPITVDRGGFACLNNQAGFLEWISASVMPQPGLAAAI